MSPKTLGQRVEAARNARGWDQRRLETEAGLGTGTVTRIEADERKEISAKTVFALAKALGVTAAWIFEGIDDPGPSQAEIERSIGGRGAPLPDTLLTANAFGNERVGKKYKASREITAAMVAEHGTTERLRSEWVDLFAAKKAAKQRFRPGNGAPKAEPPAKRHAS